MQTLRNRNTRENAPLVKRMARFLKKAARRNHRTKMLPRQWPFSGADRECRCRATTKAEFCRGRSHERSGPGASIPAVCKSVRCSSCGLDAGKW